MSMRLRFLLVDSHPELPRLAERMFTPEHEVITVQTEQQALETAMQLVPHAVIMDLAFAEPNVIRFVDYLRQRHGDLLFLAAITTRRVVVPPSALDYVGMKPATFQMLEQIAASTVERRTGKRLAADPPPRMRQR